MKLIKSLLTNVIICGGLLRLFSYFELGIVISIGEKSVKYLQITDTQMLWQTIVAFLSLGFIFWILNSPVKKILTIVSIPVNIITFGIFSLILNILIFYLFQLVINQYFDTTIAVQLGTVIQVFILSLIMSFGITTIKKLT
ncbi:hypothetical protein AGMMS50249_1810 [candidate division SR1 bacterium]|nr:hypothetical protein AGMMS50249_1810 [candidate division SR1 bacterium]